MQFSLSYLNLPGFFKWNIYDYAIMRNKLHFRNGIFSKFNFVQKIGYNLGLGFKILLNSIFMVPLLLFYVVILYLLATNS